MMEDVFPVVLVMLLCIPVAIMLLRDIFRDKESILQEKEIKSLKQRVERAEELLGALLGIVEPRQILESDLPPDVGARGGDKRK